MTINEFFECLKRHNVDFNKDIAICVDHESDGIDFDIEEEEFCLYLVAGDWGDEIKHHFISKVG